MSDLALRQADMDNQKDYRHVSRLCKACSSILTDGSLEGDIIERPHNLNRCSINEALTIRCELCRQIDFLYSEEVTTTAYWLVLTSEPWQVRKRILLNLRSTGSRSNIQSSFEHFSIFEVGCEKLVFNLAGKVLSQTHTGHDDVLNLAKY